MSRIRGEPTTELSDFEKQRAANIAERDALLKKLTLEAQSAGLLLKAPSNKTSKGQTANKTKPPVKKVKRENEAPGPRRTSSRLAGLTADSEIAKRKAEAEYDAAKAAAQAKRMRVAGDLDLGDIIVGGQKWDGTGLLAADAVANGMAKSYTRTFGEDEIKRTSNKELKSLREKMSGLQLWEPWEPNRVFMFYNILRVFYIFLIIPQVVLRLF
jgi:hypothetical protein